MFTKEFIKNVLLAIMSVVAVFIFLLGLSLLKFEGLEEAKEIYELVVVDTLAEPFVGIIAAFVVYAFGKNVAMVMHEGNLMKHEAEADKHKINFL